RRSAPTIGSWAHRRCLSPPVLRGSAEPTGSPPPVRFRCTWTRPGRLTRFGSWRPLETSLKRFRGGERGTIADANEESTGEHQGASEDIGTAAGFAEHRARQAGDDRLVHGGGPFDDLTVAGNQLAGLGQDQVPTSKVRGHGFLDPERAALAVTGE